MNALRLLAGKTAMKRIREEGLKPELFSRLLAASGGPKWLGIAGLDKYLFSEFFKDRKTPLYTLGASSGAWRLACLAQQDVLAAYGRLEAFYIGQRYDTKPSREEVSRQVTGIVAGILGDTGAAEILANPVFRSHFVVCRGRHLNRVNGKLPLALGLSVTAATNLVSRRSLGWHFERLVFSQADNDSHFRLLTDLPSRDCKLSQDNLADVLQATGSIPMVLAPVGHIEGAGEGHFYDGGITDYHFDFPLEQHQGLTLYPHFFPSIKPGWFDKSLPWRRAVANYDNALLLVPSAGFVASLPNGKIPDRDDFKTLDTQSRQRSWRQAAQASERLAEEFSRVLEGDISRIESFPG
ncbi:alpha/beta hydrolase [Shewanella sp. FJAT-52076]|uniref:alpha/beta hydrolase n=1 Tax=Shewanella sp. FJAT-52076 TaxID=2864202 RepID=UPI001C65A96D|nr:alpha/beta hydrolase [Shewanella sp. FJAT-52076]QYJ75901.1 alpha/beta hydrolase [Shewanella sp. FJAT-52076]